MLKRFVTGTSGSGTNAVVPLWVAGQGKAMAVCKKKLTQS